MRNIEDLFDWACSELEILEDEEKKDVLRDIIKAVRETKPTGDNVQTITYKAGVIRDEKGLLKIFKKWVKNHPDVFHDFNRFWYVQNAVGDLIGWTKEYQEYSNKLSKKIDEKTKKI